MLLGAETVHGALLLSADLVMPALLPGPLLCCIQMRYGRPGPHHTFFEVMLADVLLEGQAKPPSLFFLLPFFLGLPSCCANSLTWSPWLALHSIYLFALLHLCQGTS